MPVIPLGISKPIWVRMVGATSESKPEIDVVSDMILLVWVGLVNKEGFAMIKGTGEIVCFL